jgi:predicted enzyme related to lactoylglutathione lyase
LSVKIAFVMYPVTDVGKSVAFYRDVVGLPQHGMNEAWWVEFDVDGATFGIGNVDRITGLPGTAQSLVLEVQDIHAFVKRVRDCGVEVDDPAKTPNGCWITGFRDPDGNRIWLHQSKVPVRARSES